MPLKTIIIGLLLTIFISMQTIAGEKENSSLTPSFSLYNTTMEAQEEYETYTVAQYNLIRAALAITAASGISSATFLIPAIVSSALHANNIYPLTELTFSMVSIFSVCLSTTLTFLTSLPAWEGLLVITLGIGVASGLLAAGSLAPAIILTDKYVRENMRDSAVITGLLWSWSSFGLFLIPALTSLIWGIVKGGQRYHNKKKLQKVSLLLTGDRIGLSVRL